MDIYKITNKINNKIYIGKSQECYKQRFKEHTTSALSGSTKCPKLYNAMRKYGIENFICEKIDERDTQRELCLCEQYWISKLNANDDSIGYNMTSGGDGGMTWSPKGTVTVNNGVKNRQIKPEELDEYLANGWVRGGKKGGKRHNVGRWINDGEHQKRVSQEELDDYLNSGWSLGYCEKAKVNLSKSHLGNIPTNKDTTLTIEQKEKVSRMTKDAMNTPEMKAKMRAIYDSRIGMKWVTNDLISLQVKKEDIQLYLDNGYRLGRIYNRKKEGDNNE